jgi:hypothetical protein
MDGRTKQNVSEVLLQMHKNHYAYSFVKEIVKISWTLKITHKTRIHTHTHTHTHIYIYIYTGLNVNGIASEVTVCS